MWTKVPYDPSDTVRVRISSLDLPGISDMSDDYFSIVQPTIEVTSPNGGERWEVGSAQEITWTSGNLVGTVRIEYSYDNFVSDIKTLGSDESNDGSFTWTDIPCEPSSTAKVRVISTEYQAVRDVSDDYFSVSEIGIAQTWGGTQRDEAWVV